MDVLLALLVVGGLAVVLGGLTWLGVRVRRRGGGDAVMGPFDELWHPAAHRARIEVREQASLRAPAPAPGDD